jgi:hypothetical protein
VRSCQTSAVPSNPADSMGDGQMEARRPRWRYTPAELQEAVRESRSVCQVLTRLGLSASGGGGYATVQKRMRELGLDTSHFTGRGWNTGNHSGLLHSGAIPLDELLVRDSRCTNPQRLKHRLIAASLLQMRCAICGLGSAWNEAPLVLRMDHINGFRSDNRLENLRLICPNCDSQLPTFAGRNSTQRAG